MFKYIPLEQQAVEAQKKNGQLAAENEKLKSDIDYLAMMTDVDLDDDEEEPNDEE